MQAFCYKPGYDCAALSGQDSGGHRGHHAARGSPPPPLEQALGVSAMVCMAARLQLTLLPSSGMGTAHRMEAQKELVEGSNWQRCALFWPLLRTTHRWQRQGINCWSPGASLGRAPILHSLW